MPWDRGKASARSPASRWTPRVRRRLQSSEVETRSARARATHRPLTSASPDSPSRKPSDQHRFAPRLAVRTAAWNSAFPRPQARCQSRPEQSARPRKSCDGSSYGRSARPEGLSSRLRLCHAAHNLKRVINRHSDADSNRLQWQLRVGRAGNLCDSFRAGLLQGPFERLVTSAEQLVQLGFTAIDFSSLFTAREPIQHIIHEAVDHGDREQGE